MYQTVTASARAILVSKVVGWGRGLGVRRGEGTIKFYARTCLSEKLNLMVRVVWRNEAE